MKTLTLLLSLCLLSCTHKKMEDRYLVSSSVDPNSCMSELQDNKRDPFNQFFDVVINGTQSGVSYLLTGAGYTTDFVVVFVGGLAVGVVICSPIIAIEGGLRSSGRASGECVGRVAGSIWKEMPEDGIGGTIYDSTEDLRCPEVDYISKGLRQVVSCYKDRGLDELAQQQAQTIHSDPLIRKCSSAQERKEVESLITSFKN